VRQNVGGTFFTTKYTRAQIKKDEILSRILPWTPGVSGVSDFSKNCVQPVDGLDAV
jgi:hypothetical protein